MKSLLVLLFSAGKLGKVLTTGGTMLLSVFAYAFVYGWPYAAGFVLLLLCHELGHYFAARRRGLNVGAPTFIPFVGAWIQMKELPHDVETEAYVSIAGPVVGTLAALVCYYLARNYNSSLLLALAYAGCFLNLFNLIPLAPLDGGRIVAIISPKIWFLGLPVLTGAYLLHPSPLLIAIGILAIPQLIAAWRQSPEDAERAIYYAASVENRITYGAFYFGLVLFLALMTYELHIMLGPIK
jgi:Zn-dependent protease